MKKMSKVIQLSLGLSLFTNTIPTFAQTNGQYIIESTVAWPTIEESSSNSLDGPTEASEVAEDSGQPEEIIIAILNHLQNFQANVEESSIYLQIGSQLLTTDEEATTQLPAEGIIKLFVLAAFYNQVEKGIIEEKMMVQVNDSDLLSGDVLASLPIDKPFDLSTLAQLMIQSADNSATNVLINELGGVEKVNDIIHEMGFIQTELGHLMLAEEYDSENLTSASDVANLLNALYQKVLFENDFNEKALQMISQHGPIQLAASFDETVKVFGKLGEGYNALIQNDAILFEISEKTPVILVILTRSSVQPPMLNEFGEGLMQIIGGDY